MPPKIRVNLSNLSLAYLPDDIVEGFHERLESGVSWTLLEDGARHHTSRLNTDLQPRAFSEALTVQLRRSLLGGMLDEASGPLQDQLEVYIPMTVWDTERFSNKEGRVCFDSVNGVTDDLMKLAKKVVKMNDRTVLWRELYQAKVLRLIRCKMTHLDNGLMKFTALKILVLCANYLKEINTALLPKTLEFLELQSNFLKTMDMHNLPNRIAYLGVSRNIINNDFLEDMRVLPDHITVLDIGDNDIYDLEEAVRALQPLTNLAGLVLAGNPCSMASAYAPFVLSRLRSLADLDGRSLAERAPPPDAVDVHRDDLRATTFAFAAIRVMGAPQPPKLEKGVAGAFHVELELPLMDARRRRFLARRSPASLLQLLPEPEDAPEERRTPSKVDSRRSSRELASMAEESEQFNIYDHMTPIDQRIVRNYQVFMTNKVPWSPVMTFSEPAAKVLCPDLGLVRDTFRTELGVRLKYTVTYTKKPAPAKGASRAPEPQDSEVTLASFRCPLQRPVWHQAYQHFAWDSADGGTEAAYCGELDLGSLRFAEAGKQTKGRAGSGATAEDCPEHLTCHVGVSTERLT